MHLHQHIEKDVGLEHRVDESYQVQGDQSPQLIYSYQPMLSVYHECCYRMWDMST